MVLSWGKQSRAIDVPLMSKMPFSKRLRTFLACMMNTTARRFWTCWPFPIQLKMKESEVYSACALMAHSREPFSWPQITVCNHKRRDCVLLKKGAAKEIITILQSCHLKVVHLFLLRDRQRWKIASSNSKIAFKKCLLCFYKRTHCMVDHNVVVKHI